MSKDAAVGKTATDRAVIGQQIKLSVVLVFVGLIVLGLTVMVWLEGG